MSARTVATLLVGMTTGVAMVLVTQRLAAKKKRRREEAEEAEETTELYACRAAPSSGSLRTPSPSSPAIGPALNLTHVNHTIVPAEVSAEACIKWAYAEFGEGLVMSTSFGMQSAVLLHMATRVAPNIPVVWIDTGYLHRETYLFARHLAKRLNLNLHVYQSDLSPARMEALHGRLWANEDDVSHRVYGVLRKVAPMSRALTALGASALLSGVRKSQTDHRSSLDRVTFHHGQRHYRIHPLLHWTKRDVDDYIARHKLPYHPLKRKGYVSVGDAHSTRPLEAATERAERGARFGGRRQECGLHTERADPAQIDAMVRRLEAGHDGDAAPPRMDRSASDDSLLFAAVDCPDAPVHGTNRGVEIYGRESCKFCAAACRVLQSRGLPFTWYTMQRFNQKTGQLEPAEVDGVAVVARADVERRLESVAPGLPPIETVPQIFRDGDYVGGFTELCLALEIPKTVMDVSLLQIGGQLPAVCRTWDAAASSGAQLRRGGPSLQEIFAADDHSAAPSPSS
mmetsp:Transcript_1523/g.4605  ORF Transcript_1523/g.4605 Transcript_1523/m.4605 type:complete len:512 (+) Transcript_1523:125-1660(+)